MYYPRFLRRGSASTRSDARDHSARRSRKRGRWATTWRSRQQRLGQHKRENAWGHLVRTAAIWRCAILQGYCYGRQCVSEGLASRFGAALVRRRINCICPENSPFDLAELDGFTFVETGSLPGPAQPSPPEDPRRHIGAEGVPLGCAEETMKPLGELREASWAGEWLILP